MDRYVSSTQLKQELRRVKELARLGIVHVLEDGHAAYVLCSTDVYERHVAEVRAHAVWEVDVQESVRDSERDIASGRYQALDWVAASASDSAVRALNACFTEIDRALLASMLSEVAKNPDYGLTIEYDGKSTELRKVLVSPYDVLYTCTDDFEGIMVHGAVRSLDGLDSSAEEFLSR